MRRIILVIFLIVFFIESQSQIIQSRDSILVESDSLINNFKIYYYVDGCLISTKEFKNNQLIYCLFYNITKDTLFSNYYIVKSSVSKTLKKYLYRQDVFVINNNNERCIKNFDENIYRLYLISHKEFNLNGFLEYSQLYEFKFSKFEKRFISCPSETLFYNKRGKLKHRYKYSYDEELNYSTNEIK